MGYKIKAKEIMVRGRKENIQFDKGIKTGEKAERKQDEKRKPINSPCGIDEGRRCFLQFT